MRSLVHYLKHPHWRRQHRWRSAIWRMMSGVGLSGMHGLPLNRRWVDVHRRTMRLRHLDPALAGLKLVQVSDLHYSPVVWRRYLAQLVHRINELEPDVVVVTGDLITGGYRFASRAAALLSHLRAPQGVICTLGNHDYGIYGRRAMQEGERRADFLEQCLTRRGLVVLRNRAHAIRLNGAAKPLILVGLDDEWSGHMDAPRAFAEVGADQPVICLNHNPANCLDLMGFPWQWMLSGHTHGRQVATGVIGKRLYPQRYRHYTHGHYEINGRHLYVNRGLSYGQRVLDWCRPEITVFKLACASEPEA